MSLTLHRCAELSARRRVPRLYHYSQDPNASVPCRVLLESWLMQHGSMLTLKEPLVWGDKGAPDPRVEFMVDALFSEFSAATLEDIHVHLRAWLTGAYGPTYHSLNDLLPTFRKYMDRKAKAVKRIEEEDKQERRRKAWDELRNDPDQRARIDAVFEKHRKAWDWNDPKYDQETLHDLGKRKQAPQPTQPQSDEPN